ncbi:MAG: RNA-directed DNA polymerase [Eubacteriales bacterium]|nr:RNA-directed DNA polymerase [Eubacteriales bacterium]
MPDKVDHGIKEQLNIKYYLRYMDDFILIGNDEQLLNNTLNRISVELTKYGCSINEKKTTIVSLKHGIMFLGFTYRLTDSGKVLMHIDPRNVKRARLRLCRAAGKAKRGELAKEKVDEMYKDWKDHASKGNSYKLLKRMDEYYESLWRD